MSARAAIITLLAVADTAPTLLGEKGAPGAPPFSLSQSGATPTLTLSNSAGGAALVVTDGSVDLSGASGLQWPAQSSQFLFPNLFSGDVNTKMGYAFAFCTPATATPLAGGCDTHVGATSTFDGFTVGCPALAGTYNSGANQYYECLTSGDLSLAPGTVISRPTNSTITVVGFGWYCGNDSTDDLAFWVTCSPF